MKILVCGSRYWNNIEIIANFLSGFQQDTTIIHGACRGADWIAGEIAKQLQFKIHDYPVSSNEWKTIGKYAGHLRNQRMIDNEHFENDPIKLCLAFHDDIENSRGTKDMITRIKKHHIPYRIITQYDN